MATQKTIKAVVKIRYDTAANFKAKNPILAAGEKATESDTHKSKTGDGSTAYNTLAYDKADVALTFDTAPTAGSTNPVTSGGVKTALDGKLGKSDNAVSATKLQTARKINGVAFDGTSNISAPWSIANNSVKIDLTDSKYDQDTWYPVKYNGFTLQDVNITHTCYAILGDGDNPTWCSHNNGFTSIKSVTLTNSSWGNYNVVAYFTLNQELWVKYNQSHPSIIPYLFSEDMNGFFWYLRGGGIYYLYLENKSLQATIYTSRTTFANNHYTEPTKNPPATNISNRLVTSDMLQSVATSGSYTDLKNKPTIPSKVSQLTNDSGYLTGSTGVTFTITD